LAAAISALIPPPATAEVATDQLTGLAEVDRLGLWLALELALGGGSEGLDAGAPPAAGEWDVADPQPARAKATAARATTRQLRGMLVRVSTLLAPIPGPSGRTSSMR